MRGMSAKSLAGLAVGAGVAVSIARRRGRGAPCPDPCEEAEPLPPAREVGTARLLLPVTYHRAESFRGVFAADKEAVRQSLPTSALHPVRLPGGRAAVIVIAYRYHDVTAHEADGRTFSVLPYGEVLVGPLVTEEPRAPALPLVARGRGGGGPGVFVLHLPVTSRESRDGARVTWGMPKFVADMAFEDAIAGRSVRLSEGGSKILDFSVETGGRVRFSRARVRCYSVLDGQLIRTESPTASYRQRLNGPRGRLDLGDHPVADDLRRLKISPTPTVVDNVIVLRSLLPAGTAIGPARPYQGYRGIDREFGAYTVAYPWSDPIAQYAPFPWHAAIDGAWSTEGQPGSATEKATASGAGEPAVVASPTEGTTSGA